LIFERESVTKIHEREGVTRTFEREAVIKTHIYRLEDTDMLIPEIRKQPYERFYLGADFVNVIDTDVESIVLASSTIEAVDGLGEVDNTVFEVATKTVESDTILKAVVLAGTEVKSPYKFTFRIITTANNKWEKNISMDVEDL